MVTSLIRLLRTTFLLARHATAKRLSSLTLSIGFSILKKEFVVIKEVEKIQIRNMSEFSISKEFSIFIERVEQADKLWQKGRCRESISLSNEILSKLYSEYGLENEHFPPIMGSYWTKMIGHLAFLGIHKEAQNLNIVRPGIRQIFVNNNDSNMELIDAFSNHFKIL
jgi:hypothetical protein